MNHSKDIDDFKRGGRKMCGCRELQTGEPHFCAWEYHGTGPHGSDVKAHIRQGGDWRQ